MKGSKALRKKEELNGKTGKMNHEQLIKAGWGKRATYDEPRLSEIVEMYEEIGLEVHLEPVDLQNDEGCTDCLKAAPKNYMTVYTR